MKVKERLNKFIEQFKDRESFTRQELYDFFKCTALLIPLEAK